MNMVAVLSVPLMIAYDQLVVNTVNGAVKDYNVTASAGDKFNLAKPLTYVSFDGLRIGAIVVTVILIGWAIWQSKRENTARSEMTASEPKVPTGSRA